ncbi:S8 family serine peptidase [Alkalihalophilus lindianensis]|uniref:S8 family serine peptidase n=1 Tax=Alkalihalophilus lindianensis TaxID=1630542 RepID=A0ABU3XFV7_9BACI|nr:S8 family serine peptidase [Alkalihalophilus lindianensis]MDV2686790.1 S8 family serine peptidase [Alkalihalophilus lindianensis]
MYKRISIILISFFIISVLSYLFYFKNTSSVPKRTAEFLDTNWAHGYLNIDNIHSNYGLKGTGVKIAIIDTGVSNSSINIVEGINILEDTNDFSDDHGHGTHLAGIIGSTEIGVAPDSDLYIAKALDEKLEGNIENIVKAVEWSISKNVDIILMSFGTVNDDKALKNVIDKAADNNITVVSSVGNFGLQDTVDIFYPAKYENVVAVGALDKNNEIWKGTTLGEELDYLLPGQYINSHSINGDYLISSGTSMASAYMAGFIALKIEEKGNKINNRVEIEGDYDIIDGYNIFDPIKLLNKIK